MESPKEGPRDPALDFFFKFFFSSAARKHTGRVWPSNQNSPCAAMSSSPRPLPGGDQSVPNSKRVKRNEETNSDGAQVDNGEANGKEVKMTSDGVNSEEEVKGVANPTSKEQKVKGKEKEAAAHVKKTNNESSSEQKTEGKEKEAAAHAVETKKTKAKTSRLGN